MFGKNKIAWICLVILAAGIKIFSFFPGAVEKYYTMGFYPFIARLQRILFGWLPFSIGDIIYGVLIIWLIVALVRLVNRLVKRQVNSPWLLGRLRRITFICLLIYVLFNGLWGLNYDRLGIADQLQLNVQPYSTEELTDLLRCITGRLNDLDSAARLTRPPLAHAGTVFKGAVQSYTDLSARDTRFTYASPSIKSSLFYYVDDYLGFGGYYNPFTGEAQVNTADPVFSQPYTTCHEMAHQLGYAKENEANFVGYLAARSSTDKAFQYSVYFDLYLYAAGELYMLDSNLVRPFREQLKPGIRRDYRELQAFNRKFKNPFEPIVRRLYGNYLRANHQPQGIRTYNEVIAWLIAYAKKNGWETI
jgi:hypothetical protein